MFKHQFSLLSSKKQDALIYTEIFIMRNIANHGCLLGEFLPLPSIGILKAKLKWFHVSDHAM